MEAATTADDETPELSVSDPEMRQLLGMFDVPAFARRGQDLEEAVRTLHARLRHERASMMEMVALRVRQWLAATVEGDDGRDVLSGDVGGLVARVGPAIPRAASSPARRKRRALARDLAASVARFNRRWSAFVSGLDLGPINARVDRYNRYYLLEKECAFGSSRIAARGFRPREFLTHHDLFADHPPLPVVEAIA